MSKVFILTFSLLIFISESLFATDKIQIIADLPENAPVGTSYNSNILMRDNENVDDFNLALRYTKISDSSWEVTSQNEFGLQIVPYSCIVIFDEDGNISHFGANPILNQPPVLQLTTDLGHFMELMVDIGNVGNVDENGQRNGLRISGNSFVPSFEQFIMAN